MTLRLTSSSLAGTLRKLVAVGTARLRSMLATIAAPAPRIGSPGSSTGVAAGSAGAPRRGRRRGAGAAAGAAGGAAGGRSTVAVRRASPVGGRWACAGLHGGRGRRSGADARRL